MRIAPWIDKKANSLRRRIAPRPAPTAEILGYTPFSEQIKARKIRWGTEGFTHPAKKLCSKIGGQDFVRSLGFQVPEVYLRLPAITALPELADLPERFVLKPQNGNSVTNVFLMNKGRSLLEDRPMTRDDIVAKVGPDCESAFMVEELLMHHDGRDRNANDVKFYMFGGKVAFVAMIERNRSNNRLKNRYWFMTEDWKPLPIRVLSSVYPEPRLPPMPDCYPDLLSTVRAIGRRLNLFCRIDLYATSRGPVFGEFTHFPTAGRGYTPEADAWLGSLWKGVEGCEPRPQDMANMAAE